MAVHVKLKCKFTAAVSYFCLLQNVQTCSGTHQVACSVGTAVPFVLVKCRALEDPKPPLVSRLKTSGVMPVLLSLYLHDVNRDNFIFFLFFPFCRTIPPGGQALLIHEVSRSHTATHHSW